ncbi:prolipoprotein diacylglyceryl transferase [Candidatus Poribacteria bacterium]|nr:prolipoprotein diacylglyceryl transferase [Candidatus Poribacteria bacterium]
MRPTLFTIGSLPVRGYGLMVALGFLIAIFYASRKAKKEGIPPQIIFDLGLYVLISALLGARLFHTFQHLNSYESIWDAFKIWQGGLAYYGGLMLAVIVTVVYLRWKKISIVRVGDIIAPAMILGMAFGRIGCFLAGCCFGKPTSLPWGMSFPEGSLAWLEMGSQKIHPTQLYSFLSLLIIFALLNLLRKYFKIPGQIFMLTIMTYSVFRFLIDFIRYYTPDEKIGALTTSQVVSILAFIISSIFLVILSIRNKSEVGDNNGRIGNI